MKGKITETPVFWYMHGISLDQVTGNKTQKASGKGHGTAAGMGWAGMGWDGKETPL